MHNTPLIICPRRGMATDAGGQHNAGGTVDISPDNSLAFSLIDDLVNGRRISESEGADIKVRSWG